MTASAGVSVAPAPPSVTAPGYTRLHIAPFDADLLSVVVPASVRPDARNVSFHGLQTFPEKRYGFVDLPTDAAEKLRRKLNGAVLKGVKLRIERARPATETMPQPAEADKASKPADDDHRKTKKKSKKDAKPKRKSLLTDKAQLGGPAGEELVGVQLEPGRKVQRGWTQTAAEKTAATAALVQAKKEERERERKRKKRLENQAAPTGQDTVSPKELRQQKRQKKVQLRLRSKYTDEPECLMKTVLPAHRGAADAKEEATADGGGGGGSGRSRKRASKAREVVVHEFAHATKFPTFLKTSAGAADAPRKGLSFVDGTGWVDADGNVVEPLKVTRPARVAAGMDPETLAQARAAKASDKVASSDTSSSGSDSSSESDNDSDSDSDSEGESESESVGDSGSVGEGASESEEEEADTPRASAGPASPRPKSAGSAKSLTIQIPPTTAVPSTPAPANGKKTVHPLEALYKRPAQPDDAAAVATPTAASNKAAAEEKDDGAGGFRFFGGDEMDVDEEEEDDDDDDGNVADALQPPMTPFTKQEFDWRHQRSAAPTPDTAHPSRTRSFDWPTVAGVSEADEEEEEEAGERAARDVDGADDDADDGDADPASKDFQSWFWDNRGELNRAWKRRRKTAAKEKRYRENRARAERAI